MGPHYLCLLMVCTACLPRTIARGFVHVPVAKAEVKLHELISEWDKEMQIRIHQISMRVARDLVAEAKTTGGHVDDAVGKVSTALSDELEKALPELTTASLKTVTDLVDETSTSARRKLRETADERRAADIKVERARLDTEREVQLSRSRSEVANWSAGELNVAKTTAKTNLTNCQTAMVAGVDCEDSFRTALRDSQDRIQREVEQRRSADALKIDGEIDKQRLTADSDARAQADTWYTTQEGKLIEHLKAVADTATSKAQGVASLDVAELRRKMRDQLKGVISHKIDDLLEEEALASKIEARLQEFLRSLERKAQVKLIEILDKTADELVQTLSKHW